MQHKLKYNLFYSVLIVVVCITIALLIHGNKASYKSIDSKHNGVIDPRFVIFLLTSYVGLWSGLAVLVFRIIKVIKCHSFINVFLSVFNVFLGISGILVYSGNEAAIPFLHMFIYNLAIGIILFFDIFFLNILFDRTE